MNSGLHRRLWRWHFYAGLLAMPLALVLALTGIVYLFAPYDGVWFDRDQWRVEPMSQPMLTLDTQAAVAKAASAAPLVEVAFFNQPDSATAFYHQEPRGRVAHFVDPYQGRYLGERAERDRLIWWAREIHGSLLLGLPGRVLLETAASWTLVMIATGLYLWWQRRQSFRRLLLPDLKRRGRPFWRELHGVIGAVAGLAIAAFLVTGLPWTTVWKAGFNAATRITDQEAPWATQFGSHHASNHSVGGGRIALDHLAALARQLPGRITIKLPADPHGAIVLRNAPARARDAHIFIVDQYDGHVIDQASWRDLPGVQKAVMTGVDLHEGHWGGVANLMVNAGLALALIGLMTSGVWMWWKRRPKGAGLAAPNPSDAPLPWPIKAAVAAMVLFLPMVAVSLLVLLAIDHGRQWFIRA